MAVDGKWEITINSPLGAQKATLDLTASGGALTGTQQAAQGSGPLENGKVERRQAELVGQDQFAHAHDLGFHRHGGRRQAVGQRQGGRLSAPSFTGNRTA